MREINIYNLQLMDFELFLNVAKYESFTKAGEQMFMTQSRVSKRISIMEDELGLRLFIRNKRKVVLTPAGRILARRLRNISDDILNAIQEAHVAQTGMSGQLKLGFLEWGTIVFMDKLEEFRKNNPQISIDICRSNFSELRNQLFFSRMDIIFSTSYDSCQLSENEYLFIPLKEVSLVAYMSPKNPLSHRESLTINDLRSEPLLMVDRNSSSGYSEYIHGLFLKHNIHPLISRYAHDGGAHIGNLLLNTGILLASEVFLADSWQTQISRVPIQDETVTILAVCKKQNNNPALSKLLETFGYNKTG